MANKVIPTIQEKNSNVGIGTGDPFYPLTIRDGTSAFGFEEFSTNSSAHSIRLPRY